MYVSGCVPVPVADLLRGQVDFIEHGGHDPDQLFVVIHFDGPGRVFNHFIGRVFGVLVGDVFDAIDFIHLAGSVHLGPR